MPCKGVFRCVYGHVIGVITHKKEVTIKIMLDKRGVVVQMYTLIWQRFKKEIPEAIITGAS